MIALIGLIVVTASVLGGFTMAGGKVAALIHLSEIITICGASIGALVIMSPRKVLGDLLRGLMQFLKGSPYDKPSFLQLLSLFNALSKIIRRDGLLSLDGHLSNPHDSELFKKFPKIKPPIDVGEFVDQID